MAEQGSDPKEGKMPDAAEWAYKLLPAMRSWKSGMRPGTVALCMAANVLRAYRQEVLRAAAPEAPAPSAPPLDREQLRREVLAEIYQDPGSTLFGKSLVEIRRALDAEARLAEVQAERDRLREAVGSAVGDLRCNSHNPKAILHVSDRLEAALGRKG